MCILGCSCTPPSQGLLTWWLAWLPALLSYAFPMLFFRFYSLPGAMIPESRFAAICVSATRNIECVFYGCSCTPPSQGLLTWWLAWLPALLSHAFPGAMIRESRFAAICVSATRSIECVYFTGVPAHLYHKGFLPGGWLGPPPCLPMLFLCFS